MIRNDSARTITHSPTIAAALLHHEAEVVMIGGRLFKHSAVTSGAAAVEAAQNITADVFFLGVAGVHPAAALTTGDADEAAMKRVLSARAAETFVLASEEKPGLGGLLIARRRSNPRAMSGARNRLVR